MKKFRSILSLILFVAIFYGCVQIPKQELSAYTEAFQSARTASEEVLMDYAVAKKEQEAIAEKVAERSGENNSNVLDSAEFKPEDILTKGDHSNIVDERVRVFKTIARYNNALVVLASGKSVQEVKGSVNALESSITTLLTGFGAAIPYLSLVTPIVTTFLEAAERARTREEFAAAIKKGEPIIVKIIEEGLIADTKDFFGFRHTLAKRRAILIKRQGVNNLRDLIKVAATCLKPTDDALIKSKKDFKNRLLVAIAALDLKPDQQITVGGVKRNISDLSGAKAGPSGSSPPYTQLVQAQLDQLMRSAEEKVKEYQNIVRSIEAYRDVLVQYVKLLNQTAIALKAVKVKLDSPVNIQALAFELSLTAFTLKRDLEVFRQSRSL